MTDNNYDAMMDVIKELVTAIESQPQVTSGHYDRYMVALPDLAKSLNVGIACATLLFLAAGADFRGVMAAKAILEGDPA